MKYCAYCGAELPDDAALCSKCGKSLKAGNENFNLQEDTKVNDYSMKEYDKKERTSDNGATVGKILGWIGIVCSILGFMIGWYLSLAGLVLGIIGINVDKSHESARLNRIAIIISVISFIVEIMLFFIVGSMGFAVFNDIANSMPKLV